MPHIHEMPTHLNVEDTLLGPLTPGQLVRLVVGLSLAYFAWDQLTVLPVPVRAGLAGLLALRGCWSPAAGPAGSASTPGRSPPLPDLRGDPR